MFTCHECAEWSHLWYGISSSLLAAQYQLLHPETA